MSDARWITQDRFSDPATGADGNCMQAAVASLLGLSLEAVPNFAEEGWWTAIFAFMAARGLHLQDLNNTGGARYDHQAGLYLAFGPSPRGVSHVVVMRDGRMIHDPHPSRAGLLDIEGVYLIRALDPATIGPPRP